MLQAQNITVGYEKAIVLQNVNLDISDNTMVTIVGKNGTGKTTLAKSLAGLLKPIKGKIFFNGNDITNVNPRSRLTKGLVYIFQRTKIFSKLTIYDNLHNAAEIANSLSIFEKKVKLIFECFPELGKNTKTLVTSLSERDQKILLIAMGLIQNPRLLIIDELSFGIDQSIAKKIIRRLLFLSKKLKISVLLMEQNFSVGFEVAESLYVISKKSIKLQNELLRIPVGYGLLPFCSW